jgi:putative colanic acid biosynthesis glycosyltransferase
MILVSVITVVKDNSDGLMETFASLNSQLSDEWEMIIIVGKSEDDTLKTATTIASQNFRVTVHEQSGNGIYAAMNQGVEISRGKYLWFMNSGDSFADDRSISISLNEIEGSNFSLLIGGFQLKDSEKSFKFERGLVTRRSFMFSRKGGCHQSMLFVAKDVSDLGGYDTNYSLASDFDLVLRILKSKNVLRIPNILSIIEPGGRADIGIKKVYSQKHKIRKNISNSTFISCASIFWTIAAIAKGKTKGFIIKKD